MAADRMSRSRRSWSLLVGLVALAQVGVGGLTALAPAGHDVPDARLVRIEDGAARWLDRAHAVQASTRAALWNPTHGGYNLEVGVDRIYAS
jgi:hypothetical protein